MIISKQALLLLAEQLALYEVSYLKGFRAKSIVACRKIDQNIEEWNKNNANPTFKHLSVAPVDVVLSKIPRKKAEGSVLWKRQILSKQFFQDREIKE